MVNESSSLSNLHGWNPENLQQSGFALISKVLVNEDCSSAIDQVWDFYEDISNGVVRRKKPTSWQGPHYPSEGKFAAFGAGWLLGDVREVLAERVFKPFFSTGELHSSKEGFRLVLLRPKKMETFNVSTVEETESEYIRSMVVVSTGQDESIRARLSFGSNEGKEVILSQGDVLLFRSDVHVEEIYYSENKQTVFQAVPLVTYCTMVPAPAPGRMKSLLNQKVDAYKARRTGTYKVNEENAQIVPSTAPCRTYFRANPPLVTRRQAELYGLLPYHSEDWAKTMDQTTIRGICFRGGSYEALSERVERECKARSVQLTSTDVHLLSGQDKYLGGMASPCGRFIYGVPGTSRRLLRISTETGAMDCIGPSYNGKFKWLRGVEIPASSMNTPDYPDGCCIALPCNSLSFLKVNPSSRDNPVYTFGAEVLTKVCEGIDGWYFHGGNLASNGWIYCIPANAPRVVKLNPSTDEVRAFGPVFDGPQKWYGGIVGSDGCIYGIPHNAAAVLKIDPVSDEISLMEGTDGPLPVGNWKWHGGLAAGDKIIGFPNNSDQVLIIDCEKSLVYTIGDSNILKSGRHRIPQDRRYKYLGGALTNGGRYAYLFPCDAERVLRIDCLTHELSLVGPCFLDGVNKFQNGFCGRDGCVYGIPQRAIGVLRLVPGGGDGSNDHVDLIPCGEDMMSVKDKFEGGVLGLDGCIYCIPLKSKSCVKIIPEL
eukprot:scaffold154_cov129-Cylindrotheca_fusiformis.AAC.6